MKFIYLAAGKNSFHLDGREDKPKCLSLFSEGMTIIDKILENLKKVGVLDIFVVGGYKILAILENHPKLKYFYNDKWDDTKSLHSLKRANTEFNDDLLISYSDIVYNDQVLHDLMVLDADVSIGYDSEWRDRYSGRNQDMLNEAEKIILFDNDDIRIDKNSSPEENIIGEFIGLFKVKRSLVNNLEVEINSILSKNKSASVCDLINVLAKKYTISLVDVKGNWAELDTPQDLEHFNFGTKAETLKKLENKLEYSKVLEQVKFTVEDYESNSEYIIDVIQDKIKSKKLVVRSSALNEDTHNSSMAGNYESILNVRTFDKSSISNAIDLVIESYLKGGQKKVPSNQVLVQPQLIDVQMSGVVFTKDLETSAPYYIINYDLSDKTDSITSGVGGGDHYTYIYSKNSVMFPDDELLALLIKSIREVEEFTKHSSVDVEFAIANKKSFYSTS